MLGPTGECFASTLGVMDLCVFVCVRVCVVFIVLAVWTLLFIVPVWMLLFVDCSCCCLRLSALALKEKGADKQCNADEEIIDCMALLTHSVIVMETQHLELLALT